jgi:hypothetical protein
MAGLPISFADTGDAAIASYDYTDLADATGITRLYGGKTQISGTVYLRLDKNSFIGNSNPNTSGSRNAADFAKSIDIDFDPSVFQLPRTIKGTLLANIPIMITANCIMYLILRVRKVTVAAAEIEIANAMSEPYATANDPYYFSVPITVPETIIEQGEKLRLTVEGWISSSSGTVYGNVAYDPQNGIVDPGASFGADYAAGETLMQFFVPFKVEGL